MLTSKGQESRQQSPRHRKSAMTIATILIGHSMERHLPMLTLHPMFSGYMRWILYTPTDGMSVPDPTLWSIWLNIILMYVGKITQVTRDRISKHKSTIRCEALLPPIPTHFNRETQFPIMFPGDQTCTDTQKRRELHIPNRFMSDKL